MASELSAGWPSSFPVVSGPRAELVPTPGSGSGSRASRAHVHLTSLTRVPQRFRCPVTGMPAGQAAGVIWACRGDLGPLPGAAVTGALLGVFVAHELRVGVSFP